MAVSRDAVTVERMLAPAIACDDLTEVYRTPAERAAATFAAAPLSAVTDAVYRLRRHDRHDHADEEDGHAPHQPTL